MLKKPIAFQKVQQTLVSEVALKRSFAINFLNIFHMLLLSSHETLNDSYHIILKKKKKISQSGWMMVSQRRNISEFCPKTGQEIKKIKGGGRYVFLTFSGLREMFLWCLKCIQGFLQAVRAEALFHFHWKAGQKFSCFHFQLKSTVREAGLFPPCRTKKKS